MWHNWFATHGTEVAGIALEEDKFGNIFIAEVIRDGNADKTGLVDVGDQLIATSAVVYGSEDDYQGVMVRKGMQIVRLNVRGEKFNTVWIISPDFYLISISSSVYDYLC